LLRAIVNKIYNLIFLTTLLTSLLSNTKIKMVDAKILESCISGGLESCGDLYGDKFYYCNKQLQQSYMVQSSLNCVNLEVVEEYSSKIFEIFNGEIDINDVYIPNLDINDNNKEKIKEYFGSSGLDFFETNALKVWFITIIEEFGNEHIETQELYSQKFSELLNSCISRMNELMKKFIICDA